jgi:hypothetical protein
MNREPEIFQNKNRAGQKLHAWQLVRAAIFGIVIVSVTAGSETACTSCDSAKSSHDRIELKDVEPAAAAAQPALDPAPMACRPILGTSQLSPIPAIGQHRVILSWKASAQAPHPAPGMVISGYCIYRRESTTAPYTLLNTTPVSTTSCIDTRVANTHTYYYVVTAVDAQSVQSGFSAPITASIPNTPASPPLSQPPVTCWNGAVP